MRYARYFSYISNIEEICTLACKEMGVKVTGETISDRLKSHPDFPSMAAVSAVFASLNIENVAYKISDIGKIVNKGNSCILQIKNEEHGELFAILYDNPGNDSISWYNPISHKKETISISELGKIFTGFVLVYAAADNAGDPDYKYVRRDEIQRNIIHSALMSFIPVAAVLTIIYKIYSDTPIV